MDLSLNRCHSFSASCLKLRLLLKHHAHTKLQHVIHIEVAVAVLIEKLAKESATGCVLDVGSFFLKHTG